MAEVRKKVKDNKAEVDEIAVKKSRKEKKVKSIKNSAKPKEEK